jgi:hypothetical protein
MLDAQLLERSADLGQMAPVENVALGLGAAALGALAIGAVAIGSILQSVDDAGPTRCETDRDRQPIQLLPPLTIAPLPFSNVALLDWPCAVLPVEQPSRPSAYSNPARRTSISAAASNRLYACAASIIASDCAG